MGALEQISRYGVVMLCLMFDLAAKEVGLAVVMLSGRYQL